MSIASTELGWGSAYSRLTYLDRGDLLGWYNFYFFLPLSFSLSDSSSIIHGVSRLFPFLDSITFGPVGIIYCFIGYICLEFGAFDTLSGLDYLLKSSGLLQILKYRWYITALARLKIRLVWLKYLKEAVIVLSVFIDSLFIIILTLCKLDHSNCRIRGHLHFISHQIAFYKNLKFSICGYKSIEQN